MSSTCIEKLACPDCKSPQGIQTYLNIDDALGVEWYSSFCHSGCQEEKGDQYNGGPAPEVHVKTEAEIAEDVEDIRSCRIFDYRKSYRGIPIKFYRSWGARLMLSVYDGKTPYAIAFPSEDEDGLAGWKCRPLAKKDFFGIGKTKDTYPMGWSRAMTVVDDILWFTEGEFDAVALDYCLTLVGREDMYPVVSLTHGGGSLEKNWEKIKGLVISQGIRVLVFVVDDDDVGHECERVAKTLWDNVVIIKKPRHCKDANDAVKLGYAEDMGRLAMGLI